MLLQEEDLYYRHPRLTGDSRIETSGLWEELL